MWTNANKVLLGLLIVAVVCVMAYFAKKHSPNRDDTKLYELRQMYSTFPLPSDFQEIGSSFQSKAELALVTKYFRSKSRYDEVKTFYIQHLIETGWVLANERPMKDWFTDFGGRELEFSKGEYSVVIEYAGERASNDWNYGIAIEWRKKF